MQTRDQKNDLHIPFPHGHSQSLVLSSTEIKNGCNKAQMKLEKRKTKILHLRQVLKDKERENEELLVNNRRLNDLNNCKAS